jgi:hypothetical protein
MVNLESPENASKLVNRLFSTFQFGHLSNPLRSHSHIVQLMLGHVFVFRNFSEVYSFFYSLGIGTLILNECYYTVTPVISLVTKRGGRNRFWEMYIYHMYKGPIQTNE